MSKSRKGGRLTGTNAYGIRRWDIDDINKATAMLLRVRSDGTPRYTVEEIGRYMGMDVRTVEAVRNSHSFRYANRTSFEEMALMRVHRKHDPIDGRDERRRITDAVNGSDRLAQRMREVTA